MISDLDREYSFDQLHSVPIAYGLKGYSLSCSVLRKMTEMVLDKGNNKITELRTILQRESPNS